MNKRIIYTLVLFMTLFLSENLKAQHYVGVKAGTGNSAARLFPYESTNSIWGLYSGGISWKYYSKQKYIGGVEIDLEWMQKGYQVEKYFYQDLTDTTSTYTRRVNSLQMPILWQTSFVMLKEKMRVFINLGVVVSYNFDSSYEWYSELDGYLDGGYYPMETCRDNRWGYGLCGGLGVSYEIKKNFDIFVEGRYYYGYSDLLKNRTVYLDYINGSFYEMTPLRSPLDNINISIGLYYRLGSKGKK